MVDQPDVPIPRLDPLASHEARIEFVRELKALVDAGDYFVSSEDIAWAVLAELAAIRLSE